MGMSASEREQQNGRCTKLQLAGFRYISEEGARNALEYRYSGCDNSFMYRFFCSPLAEALVRRCVPLWVAPNFITCFGLLPSLLGHGLLWYFCPDLRSTCPRWSWAVVGICTFVYQTLDNMDGKQARRTGTSSPLGLMLDHGVDALNIVLSTLNVMAMLQVGGSPRECFMIYLASATPFFFATWEEFYTGSLYLGVFNGPTDGVLILCASQLLCACVEDYTAWWGLEVVSGSGFSHRDFAIGFYLLCVFGTVLANFAAVLRVVGFEARRFGMALLDTLPFAASLVGGGFWLLGTASGARAFARQPRLVFWLLGLAFIKLAIHLQLAHICGEAYRPWRRTIVFAALVLACASAAGAPWSGNAWGEVAVPLGCATVLAAACLHLAVAATREMAAVLDVRVFSISARPPAKLD